MLRVALTVALLAPLPAVAQDLTRITAKSDFVATVDGRTLTAMAVRLNVASDGSLSGRAFGTAVTGTWTWTDGYFCRTLDTATRDFPLNCQLVETDGSTIRFTADKGQGDIADLRIK
ncbi:MAG: dihydrodipicolinate reductase [Paracoccaceae bacterium]